MKVPPVETHAPDQQFEKYYFCAKNSHEQAACKGLYCVTDTD